MENSNSDCDEGSSRTMANTLTWLVVVENVIYSLIGFILAVFILVKKGNKIACVVCLLHAVGLALRAFTMSDLGA